jgi:drug/metabolite transporter (DMT)-like permease
MAASPSSPGQHSSSLGGIGLIAFTLLSWASVPLFLRYFKDCNLDPFSQNGWRYAISALFWLPWLIWTYRRGALPPALFTAALVPTAFNVVGQTLFAWGPTLLDPGFFSFVFRVQIVFVMLGAYLLFPEERATLRSPRFWVGIVLVFVGSIGLILFKPDGPGQATLLGILVSLLSGVLFAGYGLSVRYYVSKYSPVISFGVICNYTALLAVIIGLTLGTGAGMRVLGFTAFQFAMLVASAFIGIAISHVSYYAAIRRLGVTVSIGIIQLQPIFTAAGSLLLFDERLTGWQWLCGVVGLGGAIVMLSASGLRTSKAVRDEAP